LIGPVITGATGVVGSYLAHSLVRRGTPVFLVGRGPDFPDRAKRRVSAWGPVPSWEQVAFVDWSEGSFHQRVERWNPTQAIHAAAETSLGATANPKIVSTNLDLLVQMMDLCQQLELSRIDFISTAYTCGSQTGRIRETRNVGRSAFRNPYEESKWRCEELLFSDSKRFPITRIIHRPSLILPPAVYARQATPKALVRVFERLRALSHQEEDIRCSVDIRPDASPGFVHLTGFAVDAIEIFQKQFEEGASIFQYSSREIPPIFSWFDWIMAAIPKLQIAIGKTCELGERVLGDLAPYLQDRFDFDASELAEELGRTPYSSLPLSESYFRQLIGSLLKPKNNDPSLREEALV
jgi:nucleoside-diphosphate-sugar epimerase